MHHHGAVLVVTGAHGNYTAHATLDRIPPPTPDGREVFRIHVSRCADREELLAELNRQARIRADQLHIGNIAGVY